MPEVYKESEYYKDQNIGQKVTSTPSGSWEDYVMGGFEDLKADFGNVVSASKQFPIRSALTVIGFLAVVYIGFKITRSFVKIRNRLRG